MVREDTNHGKALFLAAIDGLAKLTILTSRTVY